MDPSTAFASRKSGDGIGGEGVGELGASECAGASCRLHSRDAPSATTDRHHRDHGSYSDHPNCSEPVRQRWTDVVAVICYVWSLDVPVIPPPSSLPKTIIHADKILTGKKFIETLVECEKQIPKVPGLQVDHNAGAIYCATKRVGGIDNKDVPIKDEILKYCETTISDPVKVKQCKDICDTCINEAYKDSGSNLMRTMKAIQCVISYDLISLIDKE
ncbi:venom allergen 4-like [Polyergus mexicanus]|uniref:venom allergen 4-like n=1 Tax=Polyergus mexicanus TaxID=615972 RepID=UPI0038B671DA